MPLPPSIAAWLVDTLGSPPAAELFQVRHMSHVVGVRLEDGRAVVAKARPGIERAQRCVSAQRALHAEGFPCPEPLTGVTGLDGLAVHAEVLVPGGEQLQGTAPPVVDRFATVLADLLTRLGRLAPPPPEPAPMWLAWDHDGDDVWPQDSVGHPRPSDHPLPSWLTDLAGAVRERLRAATVVDDVVGHGDWETQNLRWQDGRIHVVHDWDSLTARPECALVGAAAATFPSDRQPILAPLAASERFVATYERERGRAFSHDEREVSWGAGLWLAAHNARMEVVEAKPPLILDALGREGAERLQRAGAG